MVSLDTNTSENDAGVLFWVHVLASDLAVGDLRQINEDFSVEHTILVEVHDLGTARVSSLLLFSLGLSFGFFLSVCLSKFILPRLGHFFHHLFVLLYSALSLLQLLLGFGVETAPAATTTATSGSELGLELLILFLKLSDELGLRILIDNWLILNFLGSISIPQGVVRLFEVVISRSDGTNHDGRRVTSKGLLKHSGERRVSVWYNSSLGGFAG